MNTRERLHETSAAPSSSPGSSGNQLEAIRRSAAALLAIGDEAINKVLSGDSARFLEQSRQQGGQ